VPNSKPHPSRRRSGRGRGQALVEFALVIPIFLLVLSGILDFGFMLYSRMTVINAAREGAHAAITLVGTTTTTTIPSVVKDRAVSSTTGSGLALTTAQVEVLCVAIKTSGSCNFASPTPTAQSGDAVSVTVTYVYRSFFPLLFGSSFNLASTVQMVLE
jgi:Flp pilus assembly protein TadG